ncbi:MAG TPA: DUF2177 family protein [Burkholderiaceae bacterium]|nr:DUF2177 family protein [Burkholderiaceae bacterium]
MRLRRFAVAFAVAALVFLPLDALWLTIMGPILYRPSIGPLLAARPDLLAAALFYALYLCGVVAFAVRPNSPLQSPGASLAYGCLFGLVAYGTYDLTNQATLRGWPWTVSLADLACGSLETAVATLAARFALWHRRHA